MDRALYIKDIKAVDGTVLGYKMIQDYLYFSPRYNKNVLVPKGANLDGATYAKDIKSMGWVVHDILKKEKMFRDGTTCSNWQASVVLRDILKTEKRWFRKNSWFVTTLAWGTLRSIIGK